MPPLTNSSELDDTFDDIVDFEWDGQSVNVNANMPNFQCYSASLTLALEAKHNRVTQKNIYKQNGFL